jgi:hypothetical protein
VIRNPGGGFHPLLCGSREKEIQLPVVINRIPYHLAAAEHAGVDYLVTCDDKLLKRARRLGSLVRVVSPLELLEEKDV